MRPHTHTRILISETEGTPGSVAISDLVGTIDKAV